MNKRSLLVRFSAAGMTAVLALVVGASSASANAYRTTPYPHYEVYTIHSGNAVQKYHWSVYEPGYEDRKEGSAYTDIAICALNGEGGSRMVDLYKSFDGIPYASNPSATRDNKKTVFASKWAPSESSWELFRTWQVPMCGYTSYNGGNPFVETGYNTNSKLGFYAYWFKVVARDSTAPTIFCAGASHKERNEFISAMNSTGTSCSTSRRHDKYIGYSMNDTQDNNRNGYRIN